MQYTVKQARVLADKTQAQVANSIGVCEQTYRRIERNPGSATILQAKAIARCLGMQCDNIFFDDDSSLTRHSKDESPFAS